MHTTPKDSCSCLPKCLSITTGKTIIKWPCPGSSVVSMSDSWLRVLYPVEANFVSGVISPVTSETCGKSSQWLWKEKSCKYWYEKARKHMCVTKHHDMTLAVKVALNPNTINQPLSNAILSKLI